MSSQAAAHFGGFACLARIMSRAVRASDSARVWWDERGTAFDDQAVVVAANPASLIILSGAVGEPVAHDELPVYVAELVAELLVVAALRGLVLARRRQRPRRSPSRGPRG